MGQQDSDVRFEVVLFSFGFKYGMPTDAGMVLDVRFLPNPYWEPDMRHLTGYDKAVADYVLQSEAGRQFLDKLLPLLEFLIDHNRRAGKSGLRIAVGCTGGHHRSVAVVERIGHLLRDEALWLRVSHRDIEKE